MDDQELRSRKRESRREIRARLTSLDGETRRTAGEEVARRLRAWAGWRDARMVLSFLSTVEEIDTRAIHRFALSDGKVLALPRVVPAGLTFHRVRRPEALRSRNRYGIREPSAVLPAVRVDNRTLILVPGTAFDRAGRRLGRGGGFYDRFLAQWTGAASVGVCHSSQIIERVPAGPRDISVGWIATELELFQSET